MEWYSGLAELFHAADSNKISGEGQVRAGIRHRCAEGSVVAEGNVPNAEPQRGLYQCLANKGRRSAKALSQN